MLANRKRCRERWLANQNYSRTIEGLKEEELNTYSRVIIMICLLYFSADRLLNLSKEYLYHKIMYFKPSFADYCILGVRGKLYIEC